MSDSQKSSNPQGGNAAVSSGQSTAQQPPKPVSNEVPHLGVLDEDDEFEEFEAQEWDDPETSLAHLSSNSAGGASGLSISGERGTAGSGVTDHLWEDNWDDDDVEDDFSKALRAELEKQSGDTAPMSTN